MTTLTVKTNHGEFISEPSKNDLERDYYDRAANLLSRMSIAQQRIYKDNRFESCFGLGGALLNVTRTNTSKLPSADSEKIHAPRALGMFGGSAQEQKTAEQPSHSATPTMGKSR